MSNKSEDRTYFDMLPAEILSMIKNASENPLKLNIFHKCGFDGNKNLHAELYIQLSFDCIRVHNSFRLFAYNDEEDCDIYLCHPCKIIPEDLDEEDDITCIHRFSKLINDLDRCKKGDMTDWSLESNDLVVASYSKEKNELLISYNKLHESPTTIEFNNKQQQQEFQKFCGDFMDVLKCVEETRIKLIENQELEVVEHHSHESEQSEESEE